MGILKGFDHMKPLGLAVALLACVVTAGCGSGGTATSPVATTPPPPGYLAHASNGLLFLQWTRAGESVTGSIAASYVDPSDPTKVVNDSTSFTGTVSGESVTLNVVPSTSFAATWNGTL